MQRSPSQDALVNATTPSTTTDATSTEQHPLTQSVNASPADESNIAAHPSPRQRTSEAQQPADPASSFTETAEKVKDYVRKNCAPALSIYNATFLPYDGSYQSSNRAALGFTAIGATAYARGDSTIALASTGLAAYFVISSTCQRGFSESVKAFVTTSSKIISGACRLGVSFFNAVKNKVNRDQTAATHKMKQP